VEGRRGRGAEGQRGRGAEGQRGRGAEGQRGRGVEGRRGGGAEGRKGGGEGGGGTNESQYRHPNVVKILGDSEYMQKYVICLESAAISLKDLLPGNPKCFAAAPEKIYKIARDISLAINFLHRHNVVHHDLHPGNILIFHSWVIKITDFGSSKELGTMFAQIFIIFRISDLIHY
jgi:hypothetical protein